MSRNRDRPRTAPGRTSVMDDARNELFGHIHRCGVLRATREQQEEWMQDTVEFLGERFESLSDDDLKELSSIGMRFCAPVIANVEASAETEVEPEREPAAA